jgi:hypothetical protein
VARVIKCLNCEETFISNYCPNCGQSATTGRVTFKDTLSSFLSSAFSLEGPLMFTIKSLTLNPGRVFHEFLAGRRKIYYKPVPFFILMAALYIIIRSVLRFNPLEGMMEQQPVENLFRDASAYMVENINNLMFFLVFGIGLSLKMFYRKRYLLAEYLTIGFYISGYYLLYGILNTVFSKLTGLYTQQFNLPVLALIIVLMTTSFMENRSVGGILKNLLLAIVAVVLYVVLAYSLSLFIVVLPPIFD